MNLYGTFASMGFEMKFDQGWSLSKLDTILSDIQFWQWMK